MTGGARLSKAALLRQQAEATQRAANKADPGDTPESAIEVTCSTSADYHEKCARLGRSGGWRSSVGSMNCTPTTRARGLCNDFQSNLRLGAGCCNALESIQSWMVQRRVRTDASAADKVAAMAIYISHRHCSGTELLRAETCRRAAASAGGNLGAAAAPS